MIYDVNKIDPKEFVELLKQKDDIHIVDVSEEQHNFAYKNKIDHIPFSELEERQTELDKEKPIVLLCGYGERCFFGAAMLDNIYGFKDVKSLTGGIQALTEMMEEKK